MPSSPKKKPPSVTLAVEDVSRKPQQGRSKASLERMLAAARELMLERGSEEFTLQEVSRRGKVSIGSIYLRFDSKDNLVRAVIGNTLDDVSGEEATMLSALERECASLGEFVPRYVERYAEVLRRNAALLRLSMERAAYDPLVSGPGKDHALRATSAGTEAMLRYRDEIGGDDGELKARSAYHVIFATLARQLSLGSTYESADGYNWNQLKRELGRMCLAYLRAA
ncbi:MAG: TetR/AcrR family transcriptional regulator [Sphingomonadales bacterium]|nr:TetR/AcrR family transcriptional regulator [Sphingomonadales bacterium]